MFKGADNSLAMTCLQLFRYIGLKNKFVLACYQKYF